MPTLLIYAASAFASSFSLRLVDPLVVLIATDLATTVSLAALLSAFYSIPYAVSQPFLGPLGDRLGRARCIRGCTTGLAAVLTVSTFAPDFGWLAGSRLAAGVFAGGIVPLVLAALGDEHEMGTRQVAIGRMLFAMIGGQMAGSVVSGAVGDTFGWRAAFAIAAAIAALAAVLTWLRFPVSLPVATPVRRSTRALYQTVFSDDRSKWLLLLVFLEGALFFGAFPHLGTPLALNDGAIIAPSSLRVGVILGAFGIGGLLYAAMVGRLFNVLGARSICRWGSLLSMLAYGVIAVSSSWWMYAAGMFGAGLGFYMMHNCLQTEATDLSPEARGSAVALFAAMLFLGQGAGPVLFGLATSILPIAWVFAAIALAFPFLGQVALTRVVRRRSLDPMSVGTPA